MDIVRLGTKEGIVPGSIKLHKRTGQMAILHNPSVWLARMRLLIVRSKTPLTGYESNVVSIYCT